jgi:GT2 family glycosyltransferase
MPAHLPMQNIFPAYYEDADFWRRFKASKLRNTYYKRSRAWHSWHNHSQSSSRFLNTNTSTVTFSAIQKAVQRFTVPYLTEKWGCFNQSHGFKVSNCTYSVPWGNQSLSHWVKPSAALQKEKIAFLLANSQVA